MFPPALTGGERPNTTAASATQSRSNTVSGRCLLKTGIFQISAGDYRRFRSRCGQFGSPETDSQFAKARHWRAFLRLQRVTCFIQNYVDHDASDKVRDYQCGGRTYDGHDGTDIRIPNLEVQRGGVEVQASAPGRVIGVRDGVDDISVLTIGKAAVAGRECGNGAVIEHENGWRTQYCHMAKGSLRIKGGEVAWPLILHDTVPFAD
jgi:murein DD-endopeptidase MepM/ murein hydrolase activator NlpD